MAFTVAAVPAASIAHADGASQPLEVEVTGGATSTTTPPPTTPPTTAPPGNACPGDDPAGQTQIPVGSIRAGATLSTGTGVIVTILAVETRGGQKAGFAFEVAAGSRAISSAVIKGRNTLRRVPFDPPLQEDAAATLSVDAGDEPVTLVRLCTDASAAGAGVTVAPPGSGVDSGGSTGSGAGGPLAYTGGASGALAIAAIALTLAGWRLSHQRRSVTAG